jgi:hypothetical protein
VVEDKAHPAYAAWLAERHTARALFIIPKHIDDDWYWLYGGVRMREHGLVVSVRQPVGPACCGLHVVLGSRGGGGSRADQ